VAGLDEIYDKVIDKIATPKERLLLVEMLKEEGKPQTVIKACQKALEIFPDDINIRRLLAITHFEQGSIELAEHELETIAKQIEEFSSVYKFQAEVFRKENKTDEAIQSLKLFLAHNEGDQEATKLLAELEPAEQGSSPLPTPTLAEIYYKQGELEEAIKIYEQVVGSSPDDERSINRLIELKQTREVQEQKRATQQLVRDRKLRVLEILERWLTQIEQRKVGLSPQPWGTHG
jgi:tetratricopeptide (TPR) repeat protein